MGKRRTLVVGPLVVLLAWSIVGGCSIDPQKAKHAYVKSGIRYLEKHQYQEALIQFQNALKADPNFSEAFYQIAQTDLAIRDLTGAYGNLLQVIRIEPGRVDAHLALGNLYITGRDYQKAEGEAKLVLQKDKNNASAYTLLGLSLAPQQRHEEALAAFSKVVALRPGEANSYINVGLSELSLGRRQDAEKHLLQAIQVNPHTPNAYSNLASLYRLQQQQPRGEQVLEKGVQNNPDDEGLYFAWAESLYGQQKKDTADAALSKLRSRQAKSAAVAMRIGDFYSARSETDKAVAEYRRGIQIDSKNFEIKDHLVECLLNSGRIAEAEKANDEILKKRPKDVYAGIAAGRILIATGKSEDAIAQLRAVITKVQDSAQAHYFLAMAYIAHQNLQQAKSEFQETLRISPDMVQAQQAMLKLHIALGELNEAQALAESLAGKHPSDAGSRVLMAGVLLRQGAPAKAREQLLAARELAPNNAAISLDIAQTYAAEHKIAEAEKELERALQQNPRYTAALEQLANHAVAQNQRGKGMERVSEYIAKNPDDANAHLILGRLQAGGKDYGNAKGEFQRALALDPKLVPACLQLGNVYQQQNEIGPAIQTFEKCLVLDPKLPLVHGILGNLYEQRHERDAARKHYEQALAQNPNFGEIANNLAWMDAAEGRNLDVALGLAQKAKQIEPDSPVTTDTLAWIQYKKGLYAGAIPLFEDCIKKSPQTPTYHYHLGLALLASGDRERATRELQAALRLNLSGEDAEHARQTLKQN